MFTFLLIFIIFLIILNVTIRKNDSRQTKREEDFWEQERAANFARRKDISNLEYLTIPAEKIPHNLHTEAEEILVNLSNCKMLNLAGITNTELKLTYGSANLEELSEYDDNFTRFVQAVSAYGTELVEAGQASDARELLELAVSYHADAVNIYTTLAKIYQEVGETDKIQDLIRYASEINTIASKMITEKLQAYLP